MMVPEKTHPCSFCLFIYQTIKGNLTVLCVELYLTLNYEIVSKTISSSAEKEEKKRGRNSLTWLIKRILLLA